MILEKSTTTLFWRYGVFLVQGSHQSLIEDILHPLPGEGGALHVHLGSQVGGQLLALSLADRLLCLLLQISYRCRVCPEVHLSADEEEGDGSRSPVGLDLRNPLLPHVVVRVGVDDAEADQEDVCVGVGDQT